MTLTVVRKARTAGPRRRPRRRSVYGPVRKDTAEDRAELARVLRLTDGALGDEVRDAWLGLQGRVSLTRAEEMVRDAAVARGVTQTLYDGLVAGLSDALARGASAAADGEVEDLGLTLSFGVENELVTEIGRTTAADLVVEATDQQVAALRLIIARGLAEGRNPRVVAREVQQVIGLHARWANAVVNFRRGLEARDLSPARVDQLTGRYYQRLLRVRAETIARTEMLRAANRGQRLAWGEAVRLGELAPTATLVWIATDDDRVDDVCMSLDGTTSTLERGFPDEPPIHPRCRCTLSLEV